MTKTQYQRGSSYIPVTYTPMQPIDPQEITKDIQEKLDVIFDDSLFDPYNFTNVISPEISQYVGKVQSGELTTQEAATEIADAVESSSYTTDGSKDLRYTILPGSKPKQEQTTSLPESTTDYDITKRLEKLLEDNGVRVKVTSGYREGAKTKQGKQSWHSQKDEHGRSKAYDIVPLNGNYEELKHAFVFNPEIRNWMQENGMGILEETTPGMLLRTGGSGSHWHIGPDKIALNNYRQMISTLEKKYPKEKENLYSILKPGNKVGNKETRLFTDLKSTGWYSSEDQLKKYLPQITRYYNILTVQYKLDPKQAAGILGNLMAENTEFNPDLGSKFKGLAQNSTVIQQAIKQKYGDYSGDSQIKWIGDYVTGRLSYDPSTLGFRSKEYMQAHAGNNYTAGQSAYHFGRNYERFVNYNVGENDKAYATRKQAAEALYKYFN